MNLSINVEKYTEATIDIPIQYNNVPDSIVLRTFPKSVKLTYFVSLNDYDKVFPQFFEVNVNYNDISEDNNQVAVTLEKYPENVSNVRMNQENVDYIIEIK